MQLAPEAQPAAAAALRALAESAVPMARERAALLGEVRDALQRADDSAAIALMRRYCNLPAAEIVK